MKLKLTALLAAALLLAATSISSAAPGMVTGNANVRAGAGIHYPVVSSVQYGQAVDIAFCTPSGKWCRIEKPGKDGWVSAQFLAYGKPIDPGYGGGYPQPQQGNHGGGWGNHGGWGNGYWGNACFGDANASFCFGY